MEFKHAWRPFNSACERFSTPSTALRTPGPGTYQSEVKQNRRVQTLQSFGGQVKLIPAVKTKCMIVNTDKCDLCHAKPVGDYYQYRREILCASCFNFNWQWQEKIQRTHLQAFQKVRDCSHVHDHGGTSARIHLVDDRQMKKLQRKEAYLSLYWP